MKNLWFSQSFLTFQALVIRALQVNMVLFQSNFKCPENIDGGRVDSRRRNLPVDILYLLMKIRYFFNNCYKKVCVKLKLTSASDIG